MNSELHHTIITAVYHILGLFHCMIYTAINDRTMICSIYVVLNSSHKQVRMQLRIYARLVNVISKTVACQFNDLISLILNTPIIISSSYSPQTNYDKYCSYRIYVILSSLGKNLHNRKPRLQFPSQKRKCRCGGCYELGTTKCPVIQPRFKSSLTHPTEKGKINFF